MLLTPDRYGEISTVDLLREAAHGRIGFDRALLRELLSREKEATAKSSAGFFLDMEEEVRIDLSAEIFHLLRALRSPEAISVYVELLQDADDEDPSEIYEALAELGADAIEPLLKIHSETGPESQANIEFLLAGLRVRDSRIEALLRARLESEPADGAINVSLYGDQALKAVLEERVASLDASSPGYAHDKHELEFAIDQLSAETVADDPSAFDVFEHYPETAPPVFDVLDPDETVEYLEHPDAGVRRRAIESLANEDVDSKIAARLVEAAEGDAEVQVRAQAWQALGAAIDDEAVLKRLQNKFYDEQSPLAERAAAACALAEGDLDEELAEGLKAFYAEPETRAVALKAMWHTFDRQFEGYFEPHLDDADQEVQRQAIWGAGYLGIGHAAGKLEKLFDDPDMRDHALFAYALCCPAEVSRGRAKGLFKKIFDLAGGLSAAEVEIVESAIDQRLSMHGQEPVFHQHHKPN